MERCDLACARGKDVRLFIKDEQTGVEARTLSFGERKDQRQPPKI